MITAAKKFGTNLAPHAPVALLGIMLASSGTGFDMAYRAFFCTAISGALAGVYNALTDRQEQAIAGGMVTGASATAFGATYLLQSLTL